MIWEDMTQLWHLNIRVVSYSRDDAQNIIWSVMAPFVTRKTHEQLHISYNRASYGKVLTPKQLLSSYSTVPVPIQHLSRKLWYSSCTNTASAQAAMAHFLHQNKAHEKDLKTPDYSLTSIMVRTVHCLKYI